MATEKTHSALFLCEGSSDLALGDLVRRLFLDRGVVLRVTAPDFSRLPQHVGHDTESKLRAGVRLLEAVPDVVIAHRDADTAGVDRRRVELSEARRSAGVDCALVPVIPVRMTEAWLLLDGRAIRTVAGNPRGGAPLDLPDAGAAEGVADPKAMLRAALLAAAEVTGRRRQKVAERFPSHRRQLLERLDRHGVVGGLASFRTLVDDVQTAIATITTSR